MTSAPESERLPPASVTLSAVANERRRVVLRTLHHSDEKVLEFSTLVDRVTEHTQDRDTPDTRHRQRVRTTLHHVHLPKLEECGMIVYDTEAKQVKNVSDELSQELLALTAPYETRE